jgi:hypothetical protein
VIEDALRGSLDRPRLARHRLRVTLATCGGSNLQPEVDLDDSGALFDLMDVAVILRIADADLAALAIEPANEWLATDRDSARSPGLRRRHPLA